MDHKISPATVARGAQAIRADGSEIGEVSGLQDMSDMRDFSAALNFAFLPLHGMVTSQLIRNSEEDDDDGTSEHDRIRSGERREETVRPDMLPLMSPGLMPQVQAGSAAERQEFIHAFLNGADLSGEDAMFDIDMPRLGQIGVRVDISATRLGVSLRPRQEEAREWLRGQRDILGKTLASRIGRQVDLSIEDDA